MFYVLAFVSSLHVAAAIKSLFFILPANLTNFFEITLSVSFVDFDSNFHPWHLNHNSWACRTFLKGDLPTIMSTKEVKKDAKKEEPVKTALELLEEDDEFEVGMNVICKFNGV